MSHLEQVGDFFFFLSLSLQAAFIWAIDKSFVCFFTPLLHRAAARETDRKMQRMLEENLKLKEVSVCVEVCNSQSL